VFPDFLPGLSIAPVFKPAGSDNTYQTNSDDEMEIAIAILISGLCKITKMFHKNENIMNNAGE
jgi:hypothetical protein